MEFNEETVKHYHTKMIPIEVLKNLVLLNEHDLREKPTWYKIDGYVQFFKIRDDLRIFSELFYNRFAREIMDLKTLDYRLACVRTKDPVKKSFEEVKRYGLLSKNFQDPTCNHYLISELMNPEISDYIMYSNTGAYTLVNLLNFFKSILPKEDYEKALTYLVKLFIADGFTLQTDRNPHNISCKIPKIEGVNYKDRLRTEYLQTIPVAKDFLTTENGLTKLKDFSFNVVYDSEKCLWLDHKKAYTFKEGISWFPSLPFSEDLSFKNGEIAYQVSQTKFDGMDPNLLSLYMEYPEICKPYFERLAYDNEYKKILESFSNKPSPVVLSSKEMEYVDTTLQERQKVFKRILEY